jgi:hypothetical protein
MLVLQSTEKRGQYRRLGRVELRTADMPKKPNDFTLVGRDPVDDSHFAEVYTNEDAKVYRIVELV